MQKVFFVPKDRAVAKKKYVNTHTRTNVVVVVVVVINVGSK